MLPVGEDFSSNEKLTFHTDGADISTLGCFNTAKSGGMSMITSSTAVWRQFEREHPELTNAVEEHLFILADSKRRHQTKGHIMGKSYLKCDGLIFGKWELNRLRTAQDINDVPKLTETL